MKLHRLRLENFGPFARPQTVDFDALSEGGLFLLSGATGSGKTSVLDAICFALYGDVPGSRGAAKRLRSDHSTSPDPAMVELEFSLGLRRYRVMRTAPWERPKKRGTGTTRVHATVVLEDVGASPPRVLTSRLDEAGHQISVLLGMNLRQFTQVALLPQGDFRSFLSSGAKERHALLQQLFATRRYEDVETWFAEHRRELRRRADRHLVELTQTLTRVEEVCGHSAPDQSVVASELHIDEGAVHGWLKQQLSDLSHSHSEKANRLRAARADQDEIEDARVQARRTAELHQRGCKAQSTLAELELSATGINSLRTRAKRAQDARVVGPLIAEYQHSRSDHQKVSGELETVQASLRGRAESSVDESQLAATAELLGAERVAAERWLADEATLQARRQALATLALQEEEIQAELAQVETALGEHPAKEAALLSEIEKLNEAREVHQSCSSQLTIAEAGLTAAQEAERLAKACGEAESALLELAQQEVDAKEHWLNIREARILGMASELSAQLVSGCSCPVCGSQSHPDPARAASQRPDARREARALRSYEDLASSRQVAGESLAALRAQHKECQRAAADRSSDEWRVERDALREQKEAAAATVTAGARYQDELTALQELAQRHHLGRTRLSTQAAERADQTRRATAELEGLSTSIEHYLAGRHPSVAALIDDLDRTMSLVNQAASLAKEKHRQRELIEHLQARVDAACQELGFADKDDAQTAAQTAETIDDWESAIAEFDKAQTLAREVLRDPEVSSALRQQAPNLASLEERIARAQSVVDCLVVDTQRAEVALARLDELRVQLEDLLGQWRPCYDDYLIARELAGFIEGTSRDNLKRMRLSDYVLSQRLRQVVAAANERLGEMSGHRYSLQQSDQAEAGQRRGGLALLILDTWTGQQRPPATLSGGESFITSLALALGLADTVTHESGGRQLETLFIDEGFGSLDSESLDAVLDTLERLRGTKSIGLVSHVSEMRSRVAHQLTLKRERRGSQIETLGDPI